MLTNFRHKSTAEKRSSKAQSFVPSRPAVKHRIEKVYRNKVIGWIWLEEGPIKEECFSLVVAGAQAPARIELDARQDLAVLEGGSALGVTIRSAELGYIYDAPHSRDDVSDLINIVYDGHELRCEDTFVVPSLERGDNDLQFRNNAVLTKMADLRYLSETLSSSETEYLIKEISSKGFKGKINPFFDGNFYCNSSSDVRIAGVDPLVHYLRNGYFESRPTHTDFSNELYVNLYGTGIPGDIAPLHHWLIFGNKAGHRTNNWFDPVHYSSNSKFQNPPIGLFEHYKTVGYKSGFSPHSFFSKTKTVEPPSHSDQPDSTAIVICFHKNPYLISLMKDRLIYLADELRSIGAYVVAILDSPDDQDAKEEFSKFTVELEPYLSVISTVNETNIGFVQSSNAGLRHALSSDHHAILLNSDCFPLPGCFTSMVKCLNTDSMTGFVSPRSNNATICSFPWANNSVYDDIEVQFDRYERSKHLLPDQILSPTGVGFCLLIRNTVLSDIGLLDVEFGTGYDEENDLIMRANKVGYRVVLDNRAYAIHFGAASFASQSLTNQAANRLILEDRYRYYRDWLDRHRKGPSMLREKLAQGSLCFSGQIEIAFDLSLLYEYHNGTSAFICGFLREAVPAAQKKGFKISLICRQSAAEFHQLTTYEADILPIETRRVLDIVFFMGQPVDPIYVRDRIANSRAVYCFMLDTIATDCAHLFEQRREDAWRFTFQLSNGIVYQSNYTKSMFESRYPEVRGIPSIVSYHSLSPSEYRDPEIGSKSSHILLVGNHFAHKDVRPSGIMLASHFPDYPLVAIGKKEMLQSLPHPNITCFDAGSLDDGSIERLYAHAKVIVFPSFVEGFGFPILKAMAYGKPIVARSNSAALELQGLLHYEALYFFSRRRDLPKVVSSAIEKGTARANPNAHTWKSSAEEVLDFIGAQTEDSRGDNTVLRSLLAQA